MVNERYATIYHSSDDLNQPLNWEAGAKSAKFSLLIGYFIAQDDPNGIRTTFLAERHPRLTQHKSR